MIERQLGALRWYVVAVHYPTGLMAKRAWERLERKLDLSAGDAGIGIYRMSPKTEHGIESGAPDHVHPVAAVTLDEPTAQKARRLLRDGVEWETTNDFADALIARRARVVLSQQGKGESRILIRRGEGAGARLFQTGEMQEHEPGRG